MFKYIVIPGYVTSENDGQRHFVGPKALMQLYGVNPSDCIIVSDEQYVYSRLKGCRGTFLKLKPKYNGDNYTLDKCPKVTRC